MATTKKKILAKKTSKPVAKKAVKVAVKKAAPKKAAPKPAARKIVSKKPVSKKLSSVKPVAAKKPAVKKNMSKKISKPVAKKAAKKVEVKKVVSKAKPVAKKAVKVAVKKAAPKKALSKPAAKPVAKKAPVKTVKKAPVKTPVKPAAKLPAKKAVSKPVAKKPEIKLETKKIEKPVEKKVISKVDLKKIISTRVKKPAKKIEEVVKADKEPVLGGVRASAGIYFSMEDISAFLLNRSKVEDKNATAAQKSAALKKQAKAAAVVVPKRPLAAASIADILGFNPITESRAQFEEKDVPAKWKKYYKLLMEIKERFAIVSEDISDSVAPAKEELTHEQAVQGMDAADIGSKNFERDMAYCLLSNEQAILTEVDAAIERMRDGTYGICEATGKAIPESRLLAIPFARYTIEGQKQKEQEQKRQKSNSIRNAYGDIDEEASELESFDDNEE